MFVWVRSDNGNKNYIQDLMTRVQKKVLGKMANKNSIKFVVDENVAAVLDDFYKWAKVKIFENFT